MEQSGLGNSPNKLLEELREIRTVDVLLPVKDRRQLRLRVAAKPESHTQLLLNKMGIKLPNQSKMIENVVKKIDP